MSGLVAKAVGVLAVVALLFFGGFRAGERHLQAAWDAQKAKDAQIALDAQNTVIKNLAAQRDRAAAAEALNASLQTGYNALADSLADSVRRYEAARRSAMHPPVADPGSGPGGPAPGPEDPEAAELAGLTREAIGACLDTYRELRDIWAAEPPREPDRP